MRFILLSLLLLTNLAFAENITIVTEELSPYNYMQHGKVAGFSADLAREIMKDITVTGSIKLYPWTRAYKTAIEKKDTLIFTISRNKEREAKFKWIGPIGKPRHIHFFRLKSRSYVKMKTLEDAKHFRVGAVTDDAFTKYLLKHGFKPGNMLQLVFKEDINLRKLFRGTIELIAGEEHAIKAEAEKLGLRFNELEKAYLAIDQGGYYFAFNKDSSAGLIKRFNNSLTKMKKNGTYERLMKKYFK